MSASFTFGSFGDIITTVQLIWRLSQAISESHGSAQEFRDLVVELNLFYAALHELMRLWQSRTQSPELDRLADILKPAVTDCRESIESFYKLQFSRYAKSFSRGKDSRRTIGDVFKRIRWSILEKEKVTQLRDKLRRNKDLIDIVQARALSIAQEVDSNLITARLADLARFESQSAVRLDDQLRKVLGHLEAHDMSTTTIDKNVVAVLSEVRTTNTRISDVQAELALSPYIHAALNPYKHSSVFIEDALGFTIPVPLDINPSWETIQSMVKDQFKHRPGQELVMSKKYALQDQNGKDLCLNVDFHRLVRPGQKLAMSMLYGGKWLQANVGYDGLEFPCPRCGQARPYGSFDADSNCPNSLCDFVSRRVLDVSDTTDDIITKWLTQPTHDQGSEISSEDECTGMGMICEIIAERERADGPGIFKRVRYISRWDDLDESRGRKSLMIDGAHFWPAAHRGIAFQAAWNILSITTAELLWQPHLLPQKFSVFFFFAGHTRSTSIPIVIVFYDTLEHCRRATQASKSLDFVRNGHIRFVAMKLSEPYHAFFKGGRLDTRLGEEALELNRLREVERYGKRG